MQIAALRNIPLMEVLKQTAENTVKLYRIDERFGYSNNADLDHQPETIIATLEEEVNSKMVKTEFFEAAMESDDLVKTEFFEATLESDDLVNTEVYEAVMESDDTQSSEWSYIQYYDPLS